MTHKEIFDELNRLRDLANGCRTDNTDPKLKRRLDDLYSSLDDLYDWIWAELTGHELTEDGTEWKPKEEE